MILFKWNNIKLVIKDQMPLKRFFVNFFVTRNAWGLFSKNSHIATYNNKEKVGYNSKESSLRAAEHMSKKYPENIYNSYKCLHCEKYHIGRNKKG